MKLPIIEFGEPSNKPLVLVHGLFGQGKNLAATARHMAKTHYVMAVDLRNHGTAPWDDNHGYPEMAEDLFETFSDWDSLDFMGHSMGGKAVMWLALTRPDFVKSMLIADIAPVTYSHSHSSYAKAMRQLDLSQVKTRRDADEQLKAIVEDGGVRAFLLHSLKTGDEPYWQNNIDVLEAEMETIVGWPSVVAHYDGRALFVGGESSDYIDGEGREAIRQYFPNAKLIKIKNAGHWLHVEAPEAFNTIMGEFFSRTE